ncbi:hypothetical protein Pla100_23180 [Neorhodopirellula pilleata]|uniref:Uncharacterized protein n=1 Tax=Neorhodopirellula pilleata TaxID=2714738 RepID=A0A5C6AC49_9BACT|nr:hypothetical protein Pla100_23180 [Neorhodopirellula pilleata]
MISDDTEHTCMVAQSLIEANGDVELFARRFASRLRWWILALPAGVGKATARAGIKLRLGAKPNHPAVQKLCDLFIRQLLKWKLVWKLATLPLHWKT